MNEEWRPCRLYPDYAVSNQGRVFSFKPKSGTRFNPCGRYLTPTPNGGRRYPMVRLTAGGKLYGVLVHHLVADAWHGPRPVGAVINHLNGNKEDNRPRNLLYCSQSENTRHAHRTGLAVSPFKRGLIKSTFVRIGEKSE